MCVCISCSRWSYLCSKVHDHTDVMIWFLSYFGSVCRKQTPCSAVHVHCDALPLVCVGCQRRKLHPCSKVHVHSDALFLVSLDSVIRKKHPFSKLDGPTATEKANSNSGEC